MKAIKRTPKNAPAPCQCRNHYGAQTVCEHEKHVYRCSGCNRLVPWCFGAHDALGHLCDNCWLRITDRTTSAHA